MKKETTFQHKLIKKLKETYPEAIITKTDAGYIQGIPDVLILYKKKWALLECKRSENEEHQPNQDYYVDKANKMSFSRFIFPENEEQVLNELQQTLRPNRSARISRSKQMPLD